MSFSNLGLSPSLCQTLERLGFTTPTPVQRQAIPHVLRGTDMVARAQTGTGKTAAFGLPIVQRLAASARPSRRTPRVLVLVPTRELALQVRASLASYAAGTPLRVSTIFGGVSMVNQVRDLRNGTDIVVATPGRLLDHMTRRTIDLSAIEVLTLDEADRMLDMGFQPALRRIIPALPVKRQTLLFSATLPDEVQQLCRTLTHDAARVDVSEGHVVAANVTHHVHPVAQDQKRALLTHVLKGAAGDQALVFCKTKRGSDRVGEYLEGAGITVAVIHGNKSQGARSRALSTFKAGRVRVLVATDIAARGLDIVQLPLVINYDLPMVPEDYVHRVGRTGRAGCDGRAVSLVSSEDASLLHDIQKLLPVPIAQVTMNGFAPPSLHQASQTPGGARTVRNGRPARGASSHGPRDRHGRPGSAQGLHRRPRGSGPSRNRART